MGWKTLAQRIILYGLAQKCQGFAMTVYKFFGGRREAGVLAPSLTKAETKAAATAAKAAERAEKARIKAEAIQKRNAETLEKQAKKVSAKSDSKGSKSRSVAMGYIDSGASKTIPAVDNQTQQVLLGAETLRRLQAKINYQDGVVSFDPKAACLHPPGDKSDEGDAELQKDYEAKVMAFIAEQSKANNADGSGAASSGTDRPPPAGIPFHEPRGRPGCLWHSRAGYCINKDGKPFALNKANQAIQGLQINKAMHGLRPSPVVLKMNAADEDEDSDASMEVCPVCGSNIVSDESHLGEHGIREVRVAPD